MTKRTFLERVEENKALESFKSSSSVQPSSDPFTSSSHHKNIIFRVNIRRFKAFSNESWFSSNIKKHISMNNSLIETEKWKLFSINLLSQLLAFDMNFSFVFESAEDVKGTPLEMIFLESVLRIELAFRRAKSALNRSIVFSAASFPLLSDLLSIPTG